jgi:hypothetical protein
MRLPGDPRRQASHLATTERRSPNRSKLMSALKERKEVLNLRNLKFPSQPRVQALLVREFTDSVGDPALDVTVTVQGRANGEDYRWHELRPIQDEIFRALREAGDDRFAYVHFTTVTDL